MPYQRNLGEPEIPTSAEIRAQVTAPTWADLQSQATTYYRADEGLLSPPYIKALIKESLYSRAGPGTAYDSSTYYNAGYVVTVTGQYGNWLQTNMGDYIPLNKTADAVAVAKAEAQKVIDDAAAVTVAAIKAAIATETPIAIKEVLGSYDFSAAGISASTVKTLVKLVVDRIVFRVIQALGGVPDR